MMFEYIYLKDFKSIKSFLNDKRFEKCNRVQLNWIMHTDNNLLYYENKPLKERFPEIVPGAKRKLKGTKRGIKSALRGNISNMDIIYIHELSKHTKNCNGFGKREKVNYYTTNSDFDYYYIDHYAFKSTEEFIKYKLKKSDVMYKNSNNMDKIRSYFGCCMVTKEKIDFMENETKYNLTEFRNRIIK